MLEFIRIRMFLDLTVKFPRRMAREVLLEEYDARRAVFFFCQPVVIAWFFFKSPNARCKVKNSWTCASFSSSAANFSGLVACGANQGLIAATSAAQPPVVAVPGEEGVQRQLAAVHRALVDDHQIELVIMSSGFAMASSTRMW